MKDAAKKVAWAKFSNAGQICVAPDYVLVPASREADFVAAVKEAMVEMYLGEASANKRLPTHCCNAPCRAYLSC